MRVSCSLLCGRFSLDYFLLLVWGVGIIIIVFKLMFLFGLGAVDLFLL